MDLGLRVENAGCRFSLQTEEEVYIVHEVFVDRCYALQLRGKWQLIDVGANVGISSLMFASQPWVSRIWAFEPFPPTVASFIANMALNPDLANKICIQPFGLCGTDAFIDVNYAPDLKGSMSIHGLGHWRGKSQEPKEKVRIEVKNASRALSQCVQLAPGEKLCAKIDCEGSEYEILDDLEASGWLKNIDVIIMEWHDRQPEGLIGQLQRCGYYVHARSLNPTHAFGLMLAWRPSSVGPDVVPLQRPNSC
jgi:FkbM family methyltransferase